MGLYWAGQTGPQADLLAARFLVFFKKAVVADSSIKPPCKEMNLQSSASGSDQAVLKEDI